MLIVNILYHDQTGYSVDHSPLFLVCTSDHVPGDGNELCLGTDLRIHSNGQALMRPSIIKLEPVSQGLMRASETDSSAAA